MAGRLPQRATRTSEHEALAPALAILHARQAALGHIDEEAIHAVAAATGRSPVEVYGAVLAYPRFSLEPGRAPALSVCTGPVCRMRGADEVLRALEGAGPTHCLGLCDQAVAALTPDGPRTLRGGALTPVLLVRATHDPARTAFFGAEDPWDAVRSARALHPVAVIETIVQVDLRGRGGAGFPAGRKWQAVREAPGDQKVVVCNADESEPGTFKDRVLLDHEARRVLAGMAIAGHAVGARIGVIYIRHEYGPQHERLLDAIDELRESGLLGDEFDVIVRRGAGAYICGEETALLNSLEGRRPTPRDRPPYPFARGLFGWPTLVQNVETLAAAPAVLTREAVWFREAGRPKLYCVSGDVPSPGVFEAPMSRTASDLVVMAGGDPAQVKAFTLGGLSGGLLPPAALDTALDFDAPAEYGAFLGSGALIVLGRSRCVVRFALDAARFFAEESCGKCFPCRIGTTRLRERLETVVRRQPVDEAEVSDLTAVLATGSACGLGSSAALIAKQLLAHFREEWESHLGGRCPAGECVEAS